MFGKSLPVWDYVVGSSDDKCFGCVYHVKDTMKIKKSETYYILLVSDGPFIDSVSFVYFPAIVGI